MDPGGSLRERFEAFSQPAFGFRLAGGSGGEQYLPHRLLLDADVHLGPHLRVFMQLGNHLETRCRPGPLPTDRDRLDLQQGRPRLALKVDIASGSASRGKGSLGTFYPLFPKNNVFSGANIHTAMNLLDVYPYVQAQLRGELAMLAGVSFNWRESTKHSFYQPPGVPIVRGDANARR